MISISETAIEKSTIVFTISFQDEDGEDVVPESVQWSLVDSQANAINERQSVEIELADLAASIDIVLSGDDLQLTENERYAKKVYRYLVVEAVYNSDAGSGLSLNESIRFKIENLIHIT